MVDTCVVAQIPLRKFENFIKAPPTFFLKRCFNYLIEFNSEKQFSYKERNNLNI